jgi:hypothetical protein
MLRGPIQSRKTPIRPEIGCLQETLESRRWTNSLARAQTIIAVREDAFAEVAEREEWEIG